MPPDCSAAEMRFLHPSTFVLTTASNIDQSLSVTRLLSSKPAPWMMPDTGSSEVPSATMASWSLMSTAS